MNHEVQSCRGTHGDTHCRPWKPCTRLPYVILYVFAATALFSASFALAYPWDSRFLRWGIVVGAAAALSWPFFIVLLAKVSPLDIYGALRACVYTMAVGNSVLLVSVVLNAAAWAGNWTPQFALHVAIISSANIAMLITLRRLTCSIISLPRLLVLWFLALNGLFAILVAIAYGFYIR